MHKAQAQVLEFHRKLKVSAPDEPTLFNYPYQLRLDLIQEEVDELAEAFAAKDMVEIIDALVDILYVTYGAAVAMGVELEPFFDEVHRSNLAKAGGPVRADGKRMKPEGWKPPDINRIFEHLYGEGGK